MLLVSGEELLHTCISSKALKHKYKYALSTNLPCVSRRSQFLALLCIFPELPKLFPKIQNIVLQKANLDICCQLNS